MQAASELLLPSSLALVAVCVTACAAFVQASLGVGFAMLSVPVLAAVDPRLAPEPQLFLMLILTLATAYRERHAMVPRRVAWVIAGRVPGTLIGLGLISAASPRLLQGAIGGLVLVMAGLIATRLRIPRSAASDLGIGVLSSVSGTIATIGGPPLALLFREASGPTVRANLALIFVAGVSITIVGRSLAGQLTVDHLVVAAHMLPGLVLGFWASRFTLHRVDGPALRGGLVTVAALAGAVVLVRAIRG